MAKNVANPAIPVKLTETPFNKFFLEHIKLGGRGPKIKVPLFKLFNYILYVLHTGCQWHKLPIEKDTLGKPEISYIQVFKHCHQ